MHQDLDNLHCGQCGELLNDAVCTSCGAFNSTEGKGSASLPQYYKRAPIKFFISLLCAWILGIISVLSGVRINDSLWDSYGPINWVFAIIVLVGAVSGAVPLLAFAFVFFSLMRLRIKGGSIGMLWAAGFPMFLGGFLLTLHPLSICIQECNSPLVFPPLVTAIGTLVVLVFGANNGFQFLYSRYCWHKWSSDYDVDTGPVWTCDRCSTKRPRVEDNAATGAS